MKDREQFRARAQELISRMTIEEAAGQLLHGAPAIERLGVPAYNWWSEALHGVARAGVATVFPQAIGMGATFDPAFLHMEGHIIAREGRAKYNAAVKYGDRDIYKGLTFWSPNINIFRDPRWGRGHETYGEDPTLTGQMGNAFIEGLQGKGHYLRASACAKHYAVHSGPEGLRHSFNAQPTEKDLFETYLPAFETAVKDADVESVMGAYNAINGEPACGNERLLRRILREEWGYEGHMVSDCWAVKDFHENHHFTSRGAESASRAVRMGCDINCGCTYDRLLEGLAEGLITEEEIRESAVRAFTARFALGLFDEDCKYHEIPYTECNSKKNRLAARKAAEESIVLLKNDGVLPLKKESLETIGVIGPNAYSNAALYGNYYGESDHYVTALEGIQRAAGDEIRVLYSKGVGLNTTKDDGLSMPGRLFSEAKSVREFSDVIVVCLGLDESLEGEEGDAGNQDASGDKRDLLLPKAQRKLLEQLLPCEKPVILVVMAGSALDLSAYEKDVNAIVQAWYPGEEGGTALAEILFGQVNPSAKLPLTFYYNDQPMPEFTDYHMKGRTYKFVEAKPWYPFGYGLSYTKYSIGYVMTELTRELPVPKAGAADDRTVAFRVLVNNEGRMDGTEVVQIYCRYEGEAFEKPHHKLVAFERVEIPAGDGVQMEITVPLKNCYLIGEDGKAYLPEGKYSFLIGGCQPDERSVELYGMYPAAVSMEVRGEKGCESISFGKVHLNTEKGIYHYPDQTDYTHVEVIDTAKFSGESMINALLLDPQAKAVLTELLPQMFSEDNPNLGMLKSIPMPLDAIARMSGGAVSAELLAEIDRRLRQIV